MNERIVDISKENANTIVCVKQLALDMEQRNEQIDNRFEKMSIKWQGKIDDDVSQVIKSKVAGEIKDQTDDLKANLSRDVQEVRTEIDLLKNRQVIQSMTTMTTDDMRLFPLLKTGKHMHASSFKQNLANVKLQSDDLLDIEQFWDEIHAAFNQSLSTNKGYCDYDALSRTYDLPSLMFPPVAHPNYDDATNAYQAFE